MDNLTEIEEKAFNRGMQRAYINLLGDCLRKLNGGNPEVFTKEILLRERAETILKLRQICAEYGDDTFPDDLYIPDILEKYLYRHLPE